MFCAKCGGKNINDATFCVKCGADLTKQTPPEKKNYQDSLDVPGTLIQKELDIDSFEVNTLFANRYQVLSEGFKGGMGVVYKCKDTKLNKIVALKIIHPRLLESEQALTRFRQEVSISQELQHANIVKVFNLEEWEGKEYFTMEWVEGITLREIINQRKKESRPFSIEEAQKIIFQLADALHHAHRYTIHRDIKPENILVTNDSELKVKLTDFGIAKMLTSTGLTSISMQMGTPYYMAPEQKTDSAHVDKRADIYALGVVFYELLTLENTIGFELPSEINKSLPKEIDNVIKKALATKPDDRYGDAKELSDALKKVADTFSEQAERNLKEAEEQRKREGEKLQREAEERKQKEADQKKKEEEEKARLKREETEAEQKRIEEQKRWEEEQKRRTVETERTRITETSGQRKSFFFTNKVIAAIAVLVIIIGVYVYKSKEEPSTGPEISFPPVETPASVPPPSPAPAPEPAPAPSSNDGIVQQIKIETGKVYQMTAEVVSVDATHNTLTVSGKKGQLSMSGEAYILRDINPGSKVVVKFIGREGRAVVKTIKVVAPVPAPSPKPEVQQKSSIAMVFVKGGCYQMGDTFGDGESDEKPVHEVCVDDFYLGKYEVTQGQWKAIMGNNPSYCKNCGDSCPVDYVSWNDVQEFIKKLNQKTGKSYRLPTEAEWEYACRSGGKREKYAGGDSIESVAWHSSNLGDKTHPVGTKAPNGLGIYDMSGNVWEWVQDVYNKDAYSQHSRNNPVYEGGGASRVRRGGSWGAEPRNVRSARRGKMEPDHRHNSIGFRLLRTQ